MSTLTKVFVVLLVVFSIAFTSMTVSIASQTANWRQLAQRSEEHARVADTNLRNAIAANSAQLAAAAEAVESHRKSIAELTSKAEEAGNELEQLHADVRRLTAEKSSTEAVNRGLLTQIQSNESIREEYRKQRDDLEKQSIDLQRRNIDLNDRVNELTAQMAVLIEQRRQFEQQINVLREENERLARETRSASAALQMEEPGGAGVGKAVPLSPVAAAAIRGEVLDVAGEVVTISVGSSDGVEKEMVFVIHRNGEYVGDIKITLVDPDRSAGRLVSTRMEPGAGDQVTDVLGLAGSRG